MADATNGGRRPRGGRRPPTTDATPRERPIGELVKDLSRRPRRWSARRSSSPGRSCSRRARSRARARGCSAGAAVAGLLALGALTAALIALLDKAMATWVAALIVMALWAIVALVLAKSGQKALQRATPPAPQTVETVKEDIQWAKNPTGSAPR